MSPRFGPASPPRIRRRLRRNRSRPSTSSGIQRGCSSVNHVTSDVPMRSAAIWAPEFAPTDHSDLRTAEWFGAGVGRRMPLPSAKSAGIVGHEGRGPRACGSDNVFRRELTGGRTEVEHPFLMGHAVDMHWAPDRKVVAFQIVDDMACRRVSRVVRHGPAGQIGEFRSGEKRQ